MRAVVLAAVVLAGCYDPSYHDLACGTGNACPSGYTCVNDVCTSGELDARPDGAELDGADGSQLDAVDAPMGDAADATVDAVAPCRAGDITSPTDPTRCFRYRPSASTWAAARDGCLALGGKLADIRNAQENNALYPAIGSMLGSWLGGTDVVNEGAWLWTDGVPFTFNAWAEGYPSGGAAANCLRYAGLNSLGVAGSDWVDRPCTDQLAAVCVFLPP